MSEKSRVTPIDFNPSSLGNAEVFFYEMLRIALSKLCITAPGRIIEYDRTTHRAVIQPLTKLMYSDGSTDAEEPFTVDIMRMCAGGFIIDLPIKAGDTGWLISSDKDVTLIKRTGEISNPSSVETHSFKRGFWIPDSWNDLPISDDGRLVIQTTDGSQKISIGQKDIKVFSSNTTINTTGDCTINTGTSTRINADGEVIVKAKAGASVEATTVKIKADAVNMDTSTVSVSGMIQSKSAATGTISAASVAQVKDGIIVAIT